MTAQENQIVRIYEVVVCKNGVIQPATTISIARSESVAAQLECLDDAVKAEVFDRVVKLEGQNYNTDAASLTLESVRFSRERVILAGKARS